MNQILFNFKNFIDKSARMIWDIAID